ncbi:T9SS type A sorting domain-containing protein [Polaribacter sp. BAL334]|uniref:T9SS type A sorting domain-containing protein n=1 Tax=Polaribacter sp. BAL334 TaxID=1708178 RepID=UPI0018D22FDA|nr:T9SS type A sorting domain-containing protein [Polaribacter sp. BAL334]
MKFLLVSIFVLILAILRSFKSESGVTSIQIYDINGRLIFQKSSSNLSESLKIAHLSKGIYFVKINHKKSLRFLKK